MAMQQLSLKQLTINKDNTTILIVVGAAVFVIIFSLVASNALLKQRSYQARVIDKKKIALKQIKTNVSEVQKLKTSYLAFADSQQNVLGGSATGSGEKDGDNPRLVLDALPSKYDFPALATSLDKVFGTYGLDSIGGSDDELTQKNNSPSATSDPIEMPFSVSVNTSSGSVQTVLQQFERSIRPMQVSRLTISGRPDALKIAVDGKTYFKPAVKFDVKKETVK